MDDKRNPFEMFKHFPQFDEKFLRDLAGMDWDNSSGAFRNMGRSNWPPVDIVETFNEIIVTVDIPGLKRGDDVTVQVRGNELTLVGEKVTDTGNLPNIKVHGQERQHGKFSRTVSLPAPVDGKYARAAYRQGVLEIKITKLSDGQAETLKVNFYD